MRRLSRLDDGRVRYTLRGPWPRRGGVTELVLEPEAFLRRLAALTPSPYTHLVRTHGVFANRSALRRRLPPAPVVTGGDATGAAGDPAPVSRRSRGRLPWAQLLMRVFSIDSLRCPRCSRPMVVLALISDPPVVARILAHLGLSPEPPAIAPPRTREDDDASVEGFFADSPFVDLETPVGEVEPERDAILGSDDRPDPTAAEDDAPP